MDSKCRPYGRLDPMKSGPQDAILPHNAGRVRGARRNQDLVV